MPEMSPEIWSLFYFLSPTVSFSLFGWFLAIFFFRQPQLHLSLLSSLNLWFTVFRRVGTFSKEGIMLNIIIFNSVTSYICKAMPARFTWLGSSSEAQERLEREHLLGCAFDADSFVGFPPVYTLLRVEPLKRPPLEQHPLDTNLLAHTVDVYMHLHIQRPKHIVTVSLRTKTPTFPLPCTL